jgi:hypothetical protein
MRRLRDHGAQLIAHGGDFLAIMQALEQAAQDFDGVFG